MTLQIRAVYKGQVGEKMVIHTGLGNGDCGYRFDQGKPYLIYGNSYNQFPVEMDAPLPSDQSHPYWTDRCTRTQELNQSEIRALSRLSRG